MLAILCSEVGPLEHLSLVEMPSPPLVTGQVRVTVTAAGVNFVDALFVQGLYQVKPPLPFVPGNEVAGRVSEVAADVTSFAVGDRVFANVGLGGFSSEAVIAAHRLRRTPDSMTDGQAATCTQSYMTAWFALRYRVAAQPGETLLVLGAGGGVGLAAVDVGRHLGLRVIAAASSEDKRAAALAHGAEAVIDTTTEDVKAVARQFGGGRGVDLVYDPVGGDAAEPALRALSPGGKFLVVGFAAGSIPRLPANLVLLQNRNVIGVDWGGWVGTHLAENEAMMDEVVAAIGSGALTPVEPTAYPLADAARALADQQGRRVTGKSVLIP